MTSTSFYEQMKLNAAKKATEMAILELSCWDANPSKHEAGLKEYKINTTKRRKELESLANSNRVSVKAELVA